VRDAVIGALTELAAADPRVTLLTGDLGFKVLDEFRDRFPDRFLNAGVAEQNMTAMACGMALTGARAYTYSIANFPTLRCLEQLRNDVCYHRADVTVLAVGGGFSYGQLGMSHFAIEDLAILRALPEMTVVAPSDPWSGAELLRQLHARGGPAYLRIDKGNAGAPPGDIVLGRVREVRFGSDVAIFATGGILREAIGAAEELGEAGISATVVDVHTLKPLDCAGIRAIAERCGRVVTVEEHTIVGGLGGAIAECLLESGIPLRGFRRIGLEDCYPDTVGDQAFLRARHGLDAAAIAATVRELLRT
jgi:transketolase